MARAADADDVTQAPFVELVHHITNANTPGLQMRTKLVDELAHTALGQILSVTSLDVAAQVERPQCVDSLPRERLFRTLGGDRIEVRTGRARPGAERARALRASFDATAVS